MHSDCLDATFAALADPTRRAILARLSTGDVSVQELARPFAMSLPAISKHLKVLERAKLITRSRHAQWRPCRLKASPLKEAVDWLEYYRAFGRKAWTASTIICVNCKPRKNQQLQRKNMTAKKSKPAKTIATPTLVLKRVFHAPRELVFQAWVETKHIKQWWGPNGFTNPVCELDVRVGGEINIHMRGPDGVVYPMFGMYHEIVAPKRLVFTSGALDDKENRIFEILNTVTFTERAGKTTVTVTAEVVKKTGNADQYLQGMKEGWTQTLERLGKFVDKLSK